MSELFKLREEKFSKKDKEWQWTYTIHFKLVFNKRIISKVTITDYTWTKKGRENITKELILELLAHKINGEILTSEPKKNLAWKRDHFVLKRISFSEERYKLVFWFKDNATDHLWIRNCHQQD